MNIIHQYETLIKVFNIKTETINDCQKLATSYIASVVQQPFHEYLKIMTEMLPKSISCE